MFKDISQFNDTTDYLPILSAILIVDIIGIILSFAKIIPSKLLKKWYQTFLLSAVIADVLIIFIGFIIARAIYPYLFDSFTMLNFIILLLIIQIIHDILFYLLILAIPRGTNRMIDMFKEFADEVSYYAIIGDSVMIITAGLIAGFLANFEVNTNIIILIFNVYILQYVLYNN
jgi:hypothetical protein